MNAIISWLVILCCSVSFLSGLVPKNNTAFTPMNEREYYDGDIVAENTDGKYINLNAIDEGSEIYTPTQNKGGYRYGPTVFSNADGSIDIFFAASGLLGRWDFINYRHSPDGGKTWTDEKKVLEPTADSPDFYSCCDPGVVKIGAYWYIGYTSTTDSRGLFNHLFVARSKNIDGPYEKWNGNSWGGDPAPIVTSNGDKDEWGIGEPSFIVKEDKLYLYYTHKDTANETRLCIADANDENWPKTLEYKGAVISYPDMSSDSADVKYIDDYGKFIAVCTASRFSENSYIDIFVSDDGLHFSESCMVRKNIAACCHNCGISSRTNGHIRMSDKKYLCYAYGSTWANWATRLNEITLTLCDEPDFSDNSVKSKDIPVKGIPQASIKGFTGIICEDDLYECKIGERKTIKTYCISANSTYHQKVDIGIKFSDYDASIIKIKGKKIVPVSEGITSVTVEWNGYKTEIKVKVSA